MDSLDNLLSVVLLLSALVAGCFGIAGWAGAWPLAFLLASVGGVVGLIGILGAIVDAIIETCII